jgi:endonuclease YncB( thermonuclease family)
VRVKDYDRYGRTVAEVLLPDGRNLNQEMVKAGFAWWYRQYAPGDDRLRHLETGARNGGVGLWADATPTAPWQWRKQRRPTSAGGRYRRSEPRSIARHRR